MPRVMDFSKPQEIPPGYGREHAFVRHTDTIAPKEMSFEKLMLLHDRLAGINSLLRKERAPCLGHYYLPVPLERRFTNPEAMAHLEDFAQESYDWLKKNTSGRFYWNETSVFAGHIIEENTYIDGILQSTTQKTEGNSVFGIWVTFTHERDALLFSDRWPQFTRFMGTHGEDNPMPYLIPYTWPQAQWDKHANGLDLSAARRRALPAPLVNALPPAAETLTRD